MSKQSDAKAAQRYQDKPVPQTCSNCTHFRSERVLSAWVAAEKSDGEKHWHGREYSVELDGIEKNRRCDLGGFAIKKTATCAQFAYPG